MANNPENGFAFSISGLEEAYSAIGGLVAALHIAMECAVFPESIKVEKVASPAARLDAINSQIIRAVKGFYSEGASITDEAGGLTLALRFIEENAAAIRRAHEI